MMQRERDVNARWLKRRTRSGESPHVVVMSAGLWHMLHIHSPTDFAKQLQRLKQAMKTFLTHNEVGARVVSQSICPLLQPGMPPICQSPCLCASGSATIQLIFPQIEVTCWSSLRPEIAQ